MLHHKGSDRHATGQPTICLSANAQHMFGSYLCSVGIKLLATMTSMMDFILPVHRENCISQN